MEEELVSTSSSVKRGGADTRPSSLFAYHFPYFLMYGMTYEQFWEEDCELAQYYLEANELRSRARNEEMWLQGRYIMDAVATNMDKDYKYPSRPYPLTREEAEEVEEEERMQRMLKYMAAFTQGNNNKLMKEGNNG